jgi:hypothetical protein
MADPIVGLCWHCARPHQAADFGRETLCPNCGKATRVCRNCRFYAPGRSNDCVEPILVDPVPDKTRANFCEYFAPTTQPLSHSAVKAQAAALRQAAQSLFK